MTLRGIMSVLVLLVGFAGKGHAADAVKLRLDWIPGAEHAFMYLGREKGFFSEANLDLEILGGRGSTVSVRLVGNGDNEFAFADATTVVRAWEAGVPLIVLHVLYADTPTVLYTKDGSGITRAQDVCGKRLGVNIASTTYMQARAMLRASSGPDCTVTEVPVPGGGLSELMSGTVDVAHTYTYLDPVLGRLRGVKINEMPAREYLSLYSQTLITNKTIAGTGDVAARFTKAALKSLDYALKNPDEALAALARASPEVNADFERAKLAVVSTFLTVPDGGGRRIGRQSAEGWQRTVDTLLQLGAIKTKLDPAGRFVVGPTN